ncbi:MAG: catabolite control protein [Bacilli bacterium]|nr:catabolite control protein [Bacilli bacterium]
MKKTIRDVAKLANVSISTVSRVMNNPETVIEVKRKRVLEAIEELHYQPNALARGLISKKSHTIAALIPDIANPFYSGVIRGMEDAAKENGYSLLICNTDRNKKHLISYFENFYEKQIDGILFVSDTVYPDYYDAMKRFQFPVVLVCTHSLEYNLSSVKIDDEQASYEAVSYLIHSGHRKIGMICFDLTESISGSPRYQGFQRALREYNLMECSRYVEFAGSWYEESYEATSRLVDKYPDLTAIFTTSDEFALGTISYLNDQGVSVPEHVSVIGFDDIRFAHMTIPKLTTVAQPVYDIGFKSVTMLHEQIVYGQLMVKREILPHRLVVRNSTKSI